MKTLEDNGAKSPKNFWSHSNIGIGLIILSPAPGLSLKRKHHEASWRDMEWTISRLLL